MKLISSAFEHQGHIPKKYTCDGEEINPPLSISEAPPGTKSFVLIVDDPDVPTHLRSDGMWDHWIIFNISPDTREIREGQEPKGVHGLGTGGKTRYQGPCPPDREHRYFFKLYALDTLLSIPERSTKQAVENAMKDHILDQAEIIGIYGR